MRTRCLVLAFPRGLQGKVAGVSHLQPVSHVDDISRCIKAQCFDYVFGS